MTTESELEAIRARHVPAGKWSCRKCGQTGAPCDVMALGHEIDRLRGVEEAARSADSMLSLLWYRYVSSEVKAADPTLGLDVLRAISALRAALGAKHD